MAKASVYFTLDDIGGRHDAKDIKRELGALPGVISVSTNDSADRIAVDFDTTGISTRSIEKHLEGMGFGIVDSKTDTHIMQEVP